MPGSDIVRLPNGKTVTRTRALALGWITTDGQFTDATPLGSRAAAEATRAQREQEWRDSQRLDEAPAPTRGQRAAATRARNRAAKAATPGEPKVSEDGQSVATPEPPKVLVPRNVDHDGNEVTDPEALAKIAAETAAIEAAKAGS